MRALKWSFVLFSLGHLSAAHADDVDRVLAQFAGEPSVGELQRAAVEEAEVQPERVAALLSRVRKAALAPSLHFTVGRGTHVLGASATTIAVTSADSWYASASVGWSLDKLVLHPEELRLTRESQRLAARREHLGTEVAHLYFQRRRMQVELALRPPADPVSRAEERLRIDELGAILDGLTGGALTHTEPAGAARP